MAANEMDIRFLGDADPLAKAAKEASQAMDQVSHAADKASSSLDDLPKVQKEVAQQADKMAKSAAAAGGAVAKVATQAKSGGQAITNFGRVLQDLPFGPTGIANNLEAVGLSFKSLREEAKLTGQSIGGILLKSLMGGGGLIAGISLLSAGLSFASVGMSAWSRLFPDANEQVKTHAQLLADARKALQDYADNLDDVTQSRLKGAQNAQEELVRLKTLYDATQNANIPLAERKKLVDQLQEQYPKYFKNIKDETILAGGAKTAYDNLTTAILAASRARAAQDALVDIQKQVLALEQQQIDQQKEIEKQFGFLTNAQNKFKNALNDAQIGQGIVGFTKNLEGAEKRYTEAVRKSSDLNQQRNSLLERAANLTKNLTQTVEQHPEALLDPTGSVKEVKVKVEKVKLRPGVIEIEDIKDFRAKLPEPDDNKNKLPVRPSVSWPEPEKMKQLRLLKEEFGKFSEQVNQLLESTMGNLAINIGEGLGDAISGKGLGDAFKSIASLMGSFIQDLGKLLIKNAIQVEVFQKALATLMTNPIAALAAGIALVAIGGIIKNSVPATPRFAEGGVVSGATMALVGEGPRTSPSNPEVIAPLDKLKGMLGDTGGFGDMMPQWVLSGDTLRLWIERANKSKGLFQ